MNEFIDYNLNKSLKRSVQFEFPRKKQSFDEQLKIKTASWGCWQYYLKGQCGRRQVCFVLIPWRKKPLTHKVTL